MITEKEIRAQEAREVAAAQETARQAREKARKAIIAREAPPEVDPAKGQKDPIYIAWAEKNDPETYERFKQYLPAE